MFKFKNPSALSCNKNSLGLCAAFQLYYQFCFHFYCLGFISPITTVYPWEVEMVHY